VRGCSEVVLREGVTDESVSVVSFLGSFFLPIFGASVQAVSKLFCFFPLSSILSMAFCVIAMCDSSTIL